ncbi:MAG TPA: hypothetical protein VGK35_02835 [Actinotalea sp.]
MIHRTTWRPRHLVPALALAALLAMPSAAQAVVPAADPPSGACTDPAGITVVVDQTDLGGEVKVGCAPAAATGTAALEAAGFTDTRDASGMICAIDSLPDPCPAEFTGSYWSYWYATPGGAWQTYQEGSDTAVPQPGNVEGWRYSDGSAGPTLAAPVAGVTATTDAAVPVESATASPEVTASATEGQEQAAESGSDPADPGTSPVLVGGLVLLVLLAAAALLVVRRRSAASGHGPAGQD